MDERDLFSALSRAIRAGEVVVDLDCRRLFHTDSPIAVQAEQTRWIYGCGVVALAAGFGLGWQYGAGVVAAGFILYAAVVRPRIRRRMVERFYQSTIFEIGLFKKLWRVRGVTMRKALAQGGEIVCASPDGDWRRFALDHLMAGTAGVPPLDPKAPSA
jgi:hypothetical protein